MKKISLPNPIIMIFGGLGAFWIADIIHPGFNPIGIMILLLIPVLVIEFLFPKQEAEKPTVSEIEQQRAISGELIAENENNDE